MASVSEEEVMAFYESALRQVERKMGKKGTTDTALQQHTPRFLKNVGRWRGVFALNEPWRNSHGYSIINLEPRHKSGEHWIAKANDLIYDSFGRNGIVETREKENQIGGGDDKRSLHYTDSDVEQRKREDNCGQRCIAWLMVYERFGREGAQLV